MRLSVGCDFLGTGAWFSTGLIYHTSFCGSDEGIARIGVWQDAAAGRSKLRPYKVQEAAKIHKACDGTNAPR